MSETGRERMLKAFWGGRPDTVPVSPDVSNYLPCKFTRRPFWMIYAFNHPPLWKAYIALMKKFKFDGWVGVPINPPFKFLIKSFNVKIRILRWTPKVLAIKETIHTSEGEMTRIDVFPTGDASYAPTNLVKDVKKDYKKVKEFFFTDPQRLDTGPIKKAREMMGDMGVIFPGGFYGFTTPFGWWAGLRDGGPPQAILDFHNHPDIMKELIGEYIEYYKEIIKVSIEAGVDEIVIQGSNSSMSVVSPEFFKKWDLPFIKEVVKACQEYGVPSHLHVCGKSRQIVDLVANTGLNVIEPLERPPTGNVELAEVKKKYGDRLCLKGNVNTVLTLLEGTPKDVEEEVKACLKAGAEGGGFVLSTGDQVNIATPIENLIAFIQAGRKYGEYPIKI